MTKKNSKSSEEFWKGIERIVEKASKLYGLSSEDVLYKNKAGIIDEEKVYKIPSLLQEAKKIYSETYLTRYNDKLGPNAYDIVDAMGNVIAYAWFEDDKYKFVTNNQQIYKRMN